MIFDHLQRISTLHDDVLKFGLRGGLLSKSVAVGYIYHTSRRRTNKSVAARLPFNQVRALSVFVFI